MTLLCHDGDKATTQQQHNNNNNTTTTTWKKIFFNLALSQFTTKHTTQIVSNKQRAILESPNDRWFRPPGVSSGIVHVGETFHVGAAQERGTRIRIFLELSEMLDRAKRK